MSAEPKEISALDPYQGSGETEEGLGKHEHVEEALSLVALADAHRTFADISVGAPSPAEAPRPQTLTEKLIEQGIWTEDTCDVPARLFPYLGPDDFLSILHSSFDLDDKRKFEKFVENVARIAGSARSGDLAFLGRVREAQIRLRLLLHGNSLDEIAQQREVTVPKVRASFTLLATNINGKNRAMTRQLFVDTYGLIGDKPAGNPKRTVSSVGVSGKTPTAVAAKPAPQASEVSRYATAAWNRDTKAEVEKELEELIVGLARLPGMPENAGAAWREFLRDKQEVAEEVPLKEQHAVALVLRDLIVEHFASPADEVHGVYNKKLRLDPGAESVARRLLGFPVPALSETKFADPKSVWELLNWFRRENPRFDEMNFQQVERNVTTALRQILDATRSVARKH